MSLMPCGRTNCENILCDRLILEGTEYICNSCYSELLEYYATWEEIRLPKAEIRKRIEDFMDTSVGTYSRVQDVDISEEFKRLTGE